MHDLQPLHRAFPEMPLATISDSQASVIRGRNIAGTVLHGLPEDLFRPNYEPKGGYLAFLGRMAPEAIGDYLAGPNHVLPTSGAARYASGLSPLSFMKRSSLIETDRAALAAIGPAAVVLADAEGLPSHAASVRLRLD